MNQHIFKLFFIILQLKNIQNAYDNHIAIIRKSLENAEQHIINIQNTSHKHTKYI